MNTPHINKAHCRRYILDRAKATRAKVFTRVSDDVFLHLDAMVRAHMDGIVRQQPSKGKTIML